MHPDPGAIHEWTEEHGAATISLPHSQNVEVVLHEPLVDSVKMQIGRNDLIIIEQENELGFCRVDCCIASNADANIVLLEINHFAVFGGLGILAREPVFQASHRQRPQSWARRTPFEASEQDDGRPKADEWF